MSSLASSVLVVDDDRDIREALAETLSDAGYAVRTAENGADALAQLRVSPRACVVILDLMMPVMDGSAFRSAQLSDAALAPIPVIVLTADGNAAMKAGAIRADAFMRKPVRSQDLLDLVARYCRAPGGRPTA